MHTRRANICELAELDDWSPSATIPMQHPAWVQALAQTINVDDRLFAISDADEGSIFLALKRHHDDRVYQLGSDWPNGDGEPMDVICPPGARLDGLARALLATGSPLDLRRVPFDSAIIPALKRACRNRAILRLHPMKSSCPFIQLDESWRVPETKFNAGRQSDFRRMRRRAEGFGNVTFDVTAPDAHNVSSAVDEAFSIEAASWKGVDGTAVAQTHWLPFYSQFASAAARAGILRVCFLRVDGRGIAMQFAVELNDAFWLLKIGYDSKFDRCSPGSLLMLETLRYAAARGLRSYEFLGTDDPWTTSWTTRTRAMLHVKVYPFTLQGTAAFYSDEGATHWTALKGKARKLPRKAAKPLRALFRRPGSNG